VHGDIGKRYDECAPVDRAPLGEVHTPLGGRTAERGVNDRSNRGVLPLKSSLRVTTLLLAVQCLAPAAAARQSSAAQEDIQPGRSKAPLFAVDVAKGKPAPTPARGTGVKDIVTGIFGDFAHLPSLSNVAPALIGTAATLAAHQIDYDVNSHFAGDGAVHDSFYPGKIIGNGGVQFAGAVLTYAIGRATDRPTATYVGMDLLRAQAVTGALTLVLKAAIRRERPDGSGNTSFPSGHASVTFATATVLGRYFGWRVAIPSYVMAAYVAASRLQENKHYLSDVVAGASIGYIVGRTVMREGQPKYALVPVMQPHGAAVIVSRVW